MTYVLEPFLFVFFEYEIKVSPLHESVFGNAYLHGAPGFLKHYG